MAQAYLEGMKISSDEIREVTGQYQAELGMEGNEKSGVAIQQRQRQGDNATYHYIDNLAIGIRFTGKILIDLIPKVYDTKRVVKIMGMDGVENQVTIDPQHPDPYTEKAVNKDSIHSIFNPNVGKYDVEAEIGPDNGTQRQEAFKALSALMAQDKDLMKIAGDILVKMSDFPMADVLAERLKRAVPPSILGEAPPPALVQAQQQLQESNQKLAQTQDMMRKQAEALTEAKGRISIEQQQKDIDRYKAVTDRIKVIMATITTPAQRDQMIHDLMMEEHTTSLGMMADANSSALNLFEAHNQPEPSPQAANEPAAA